ncbi:hypothetical protein CDD83_3668 [Cordyceps sp. RAO-2017]|nr:hypothetical protein CDD83_3668 [Cordyceps sp. RAO-2017]
MSSWAVATLRPLRASCLRRASRGGLLSLHVGIPSGRIGIQALVVLRPAQRRHRSDKSDAPSPPGPQQSPITFSRFARRAFGVSLRNLALAVSPRGIRSAYRDSPFVTGTTIVMLVLLVGVSFVAIRAYIRTFYNAELSIYPPPIANTLRRAIYYTKIKPDPELALRLYRKAMEQCTELGLDPFSDEVLGIRIYVSSWLERLCSYTSALDVLESVLGDCRRWVDVMEQAVKDGKVDDAGRYKAAATAPAPEAKAQAGGDAPSDAPSEGVAETETLWRKRERLLAKAIGTSVKLGELYSDEHVLDPDKSHAHLLWAVETSLREFQRRKTQGLRPGEQGWLTPEQLGGSMESLGRDYERRSQFQLAIPLFFQALRLCESPCHRAVIMNNLSAAFAQHPIYSAGQQPDAAGGLLGGQPPGPAMPATRKECLEAALNWARNAHEHARDVRGDDRTTECDEACAVALCNWADVAAMLGKPQLARAKYDECIDLSRKMDFPQGVRQAQEGLARLTSTAPERI